MLVSFIIIKLCIFTGISTFGKNAVVCGRSKNVGMPIAMLLHADGAGTFESSQNVIGSIPCVEDYKECRVNNNSN